jgi:hypothetical protein
VVPLAGIFGLTIPCLALVVMEWVLLGIFWLVLWGPMDVEVFVLRVAKGSTAWVSYKWGRGYIFSRYGRELFHSLGDYCVSYG